MFILPRAYDVIIIVLQSDWYATRVPPAQVLCTGDKKICNFKLKPWSQLFVEVEGIILHEYDVAVHRVSVFHTSHVPTPHTSDQAGNANDYIIIHDMKVIKHFKHPPPPPISEPSESRVWKPRRLWCSLYIVIFCYCFLSDSFIITPGRLFYDAVFVLWQSHGNQTRNESGERSRLEMERSRWWRGLCGDNIVGDEWHGSRRECCSRSMGWWQPLQLQMRHGWEVWPESVQYHAVRSVSFACAYNSFSKTVIHFVSIHKLLYIASWGGEEGRRVLAYRLCIGFRGGVVWLIRLCIGYKGGAG